MNQTMRRLTSVVAFCLATAGCATGPEALTASSGAAVYEQTDLSTLTYRAVDLILAAAPDVSRKTPLVVASLTDAQNLESSSAFGNIIADMIRTRLAQTGHQTAEVRLRTSMHLKPDQGEFLLSRNRAALMFPPSTAAVVTGTYATSYAKVYVSIKLISATDGHIVTGADYVVPLKDVLGLVPENHT